MEAEKSRQRANRPDVRLYRPPASRLGRLTMTEETKECPPEPEAIPRFNGNSLDRHRIKNPSPQWNNFSEELPAVDSKKQNANPAPSTQSRSAPERPNARQSRGGRNKAPPRHQLSESVIERQVPSRIAPIQSSYNHQQNGNQSTSAREYRNSNRANQLSISSDGYFSNSNTKSTVHPNEAKREYPPTLITSQPSDKAAPPSKQHSAKVKLRWQESDDSHISNANGEYRTKAESVHSERPQQQQQPASVEHRRRPLPERQHLVAANDPKSTSPAQKNAPKKDQLKMDNTKSANGTKTRGLITLKATSSAPVAIRPSAPSSLPKERNSLSLSNASSHSAASNSSLSTPPKGGLLRLNNESMKILNQTLKNDSEKRARQNARDNGAHFPAETSAVNLDFDYARRLADKLDYFIHSRSSQGGLIDHTDPMGESLRHQLMSFYETVLLSDYKVAGQKQALQLIWSQCFYPFVDAYRAEISKCPANVRKGKAPAGTAIAVTTANPATVQHSLALLASIVTEGTHFFEGLLQKLRSAYDVSYKSLLERRKHYDLNRALFSHLQDITFYVKIIFIYLGDLTRYYESAQIAPNFESPKAYYMKAHLLVPKNSHACSQIAMLSYYQKNYFDSLYFFIRSFETEMNPDSSPKAVKGCVPPSSRHRHKSMLPQLFDDIRPGFEENLRKLKADFEAHQVRNKVARQRLNASHMHINKNYRIEYWIRPTGTISKCDMYNFYDLAAIASNNEDDPDLLNFYFTHILPQYSSSELKKRFIYSFLIVHGMLNCRSGLDSFFDVANSMILEFDMILTHGYTSTVGSATSEGLMSLSSMRLIQLMTINFYTISNTLTEEDSRKNAAQYSFTHMNAYFILSTMMTMILRRLLSLGEVFRRKHGQFMEEFVSLNRKDGKGVPRVSREESREVFEEDSAHIESLFAFSKKRNSDSATNGESESVQQQATAAESAAQLQDWKDFYQLLPLVKIWTDWVISAKPRFPPHEMNDLKTSRQDENLWQVFARFLTFLDEFKFYPVNFYIDPSNEASPLALTAPKSGNLKNCEYELVQLPEDRCLDGFKLILNAPESSKYIRLPFIPEIAYTYMRISSIQTFGDYLCGMKQPYLRFCSRTNQYESLVGLDDIEGHPGLKLQNIQEQVFHESLRQLQLPSHSEGESSAESGGVQTDDEDDYEDEEEAIEEMTRLDIASAERRQLRQYRMLKKQNPKHGCYFKMLSHRNEHHQRYIIKPRYVIFDTNCFINDLGAIKEIFTKAVPFTVTIPLIVVHELESMVARGKRIESEQSTIGSELYGQPDAPMTERYLELAKKATEAMEFLKEAFTQYRNCIRSVTGKGTLLDTIEYTEDGNDSNTFNNDDVILYSCTNLISDGQADNSRKNMEKLLKDAGEKIDDRDEFIYRDVILITEDVNLRLKSLGHQVPVKKLNQFLKWTRALYREMDQQSRQSPKPKIELTTA